LFGAEGHGRADSSIKKSGGVGGGVILNWGERARGDIFSNEVSGCFWKSRGFFGTRGVDNEAMVGEGRSEGSGFGVTVLGREKGVGQDVINIYIGEESGGVEGVKYRVHGGVRDGGDVIPPKRGPGETKVDCGEVGGDEGEDEGVGVWGWEEERPVKVLNVCSVEIDKLVGTEGWLEGVEVWEGVVEGEEGILRVGKLPIKDGTDFAGVIFGLCKVVTSGRVTGNFNAVELEEVDRHSPECRDVVVGEYGRRRWGLETRAGEVRVLEDCLGRDGEVANRAKRGPGEGVGVGRWEETMKVGRNGGRGEGKEGWGVGHEEGEGSKLFEEDGEGGENDAAVCRREFAGEAGWKGEKEWSCTAEKRWGVPGEMGMLWGEVWGGVWWGVWWKRWGAVEGERGGVWGGEKRTSGGPSFGGGPAMGSAWYVPVLDVESGKGTWQRWAQSAHEYLWGEQYK
jgi:hypothetical protein